MLGSLAYSVALTGGAAAAAAGPKTYADFQARLLVLAPVAHDWFETPLPAARRTTAAAATGGLTGSSWGPSSAIGFGRGSPNSICRIIQHGLPSEAVFNTQVSEGRGIYLLIENLDETGTADPAVVTRNGFTSSSATDVFTSKCTKIIYWDSSKAAGQEPRQIDPSTGSADTLYTW